MKKLLLTAILFAGIAGISNAQTQKKEEKKTEVKMTPAATTAKPATVKKAKVVTQVKKETPAANPVASPMAVEKANDHSAVVKKKDGTPDRRYKKAKKLKKDGTLDKRYKENKPQ